jgi:23S rRNA (uracil1939-C5)-methyltransferase
MPRCPHFGACGGCRLQDREDHRYISEKCELLAAALRRAGFVDVALSPPVRTGPGERRRMDLAARRRRQGTTLGLHRTHSTEVIDLTTCLVLDPRLVALMPPLRDLLSRLDTMHHEGSVIANLLDAGADLLLRTDAPLTLADRVAMADFAHMHRLPRIAWALGNDEPEPIAVLRPPITSFSGINVTPPPGAFLQASASGEAGIIGAALAALPTRGQIAELFAGCGTITFALAQRARVTAWEGNASLLGTLRHAANRGGLAGRVTAIERDLVRQPLQPRELAPFSCVLLDPPPAGAAAQIAQIAAAKTPIVIYVSCNPATLARDARTLRQAGYRLASAVPIDQFLWSTRLESVVVLVLN